MESLVNSQGIWTPAISRNTKKLKILDWYSRSKPKIASTHLSMPQVVLISLLFFVSCFGSFGPTAVRCIFSLADLEM
jgi:hypothetical protein